MFESQSSLFDQIRKSDHDHAMLISLSPHNHRPTLCALHAFCMELASIPYQVNDPAGGLFRLQWWKDHVSNKTGANEHPVLGALYANDLDVTMLIPIIEARGMIMQGTALESMTDLTRRTRSTYGAEMALWALQTGTDKGVSEPQALAYTLLAHIRATPWDQPDNRCHIPHKIMAQFGLHPAQFHSTHPDKLVPVWEMLATHAENVLRQTEKPESKLFKAHRRLCDLYLGQLKKAGYNPYALRPIPFKALRLLLA